MLLHGNPAVDVFNGLKLGAGGELGIGVGEEEWGSGEREVLEGFIDRTDGLVDLVVSRFGDAPQGESTDSVSTSGTSDNNKISKSEWQGAGQHARPSDGVIFSGIGAITRFSVRDISSWMEMLYRYGQDAYGVRDNPSAVHRRKRKRQSYSNIIPGTKSKKPLNQQSPEPKSNSVTGQRSSSPIGIPPPIVEPLRASSAIANTPSSPRESAAQGKGNNSSPLQTTAQASQSGTEMLMKYLTLGVYGSKWATFPKTPVVHQRISDLRDEDGGVGAGSSHGNKNSALLGEHRTSHGYFMIGLQGELDQDSSVDDDEQDTEIGTDPDSVLGNQNWNSRTMLRTIQVERANRTVAGSSGSFATSGRLTCIGLQKWVCNDM